MWLRSPQRNRPGDAVTTTLTDYLRLAAPHLPSSLLSPEGLAHLERLARLMPPVSASGFECRLGAPDPLADFGVRFLAADGSRAVLAGREDAPFHLPGFLLEHPVWRRLRDFGARWDTPGTRLHAEVGDIFLEFDVAGPPPEVPIPSFFIEYDKQARHRRETMEEALGLLWGEPLSPAVGERVGACLEALPAGAKVSAVGAMFSRRFEGVRLCLYGLGPRSIPEYLARVGWPGEPEALAAQLAGVADRVERFSLCFDVGTRVLPRVGVELHLAENLQEDGARWRLLLERLVEQGLCLPSKRDALLGWLGHTHTRAHEATMPEHLRAVARAQQPELLCAFLRRLNHVKLVHAPGQPTEAKAYLGFLQAWVGYDASRQTYLLGDLERVRGAARG